MMINGYHLIYIVDGEITFILSYVYVYCHPHPPIVSINLCRLIVKDCKGFFPLFRLPYSPNYFDLPFQFDELRKNFLVFFIIP